MKTYKLYINPAALRELKKDIWSEDYIDARLMENGQKHEIKLAFRGHHIRNHRKKSYDILFIKPLLQNTIKAIHLNGEYKDPSLIRNKLSMDFFQSIGVLAPETEHVLLHINGMFNGIYLQLESFNQDSLKKRNLPDGPIFYAINNDANFSLLTAEGDPKPRLDEGYSQQLGTEEDHRLLLELLAKINTLSNLEFNEQIGDFLNIENYLRWLAGAICTQNFDGFVHNYALYRNSQTGQFEISPWDYDATWGIDVHGEELEPDYVPIEGYNTLTARILHCKAYRQRYQQILSDILQNEFTPEFQAPIIENLLNQIRPYISKDPYAKKNLQKFNGEYSYILNFIKERNTYLTEQLGSLD